VAAILEDMPGPADLRLHKAGGRCVIAAGSRVLFRLRRGRYRDAEYRAAVAAAAGLPGPAGAVLRLTGNYIATLHNAALRSGPAALTGQPQPGRPGKLTGADRAAAAAWRDQGSTPDAQTGRRPGIAHTTVARRLGPRPAPPDGPASRSRDRRRRAAAGAAVRRGRVTPPGAGSRCRCRQARESADTR
jgi:hypothetical protein